MTGQRANQCARCGVAHSRYRDKAHTKPASYCGSCHAEYMREKQRPKNRAELKRLRAELKRLRKQE